MNVRQIMSVLIITDSLLVGCSSQLVLPAYTDSVTENTVPADALRLQYIGVGGHIISYKGTQIMTAPSITNPHFMFSGPFFPLSADEEKIDRYLPDVSNVQMLLVGHGHYDHMLDVPYVMQKHAKKAHIFGSNSVAHTMKPAIAAERIHAMNDVMARKDALGEWMYGASGKVRIMAIESDHAPHIMGIKLLGGQVDEGLESIPWHGFGWKEGQTLAFVIDFLEDDQSIAHRIFYQDAASQSPLGLVPELNDGKPFDVAILCPASFDQVHDYPESVVRNTQASTFVLGHWEDFFANDLSGEQRFVRLTDQKAFIERLESVMSPESDWVLPSLFSTMYFTSNGQLLK